MCSATYLLKSENMGWMKELPNVDFKSRDNSDSTGRSILWGLAAARTKHRYRLKSLHLYEILQISYPIWSDFIQINRRSVLCDSQPRMTAEIGFSFAGRTTCPVALDICLFDFGIERLLAERVSVGYGLHRTRRKYRSRWLILTYINGSRLRVEQYVEEGLLETHAYAKWAYPAAIPFGNPGHDCRAKGSLSASYRSLSHWLLSNTCPHNRNLVS